MCKRIWALLQIHARQCKKDRCVFFLSSFEGKSPIQPPTHPFPFSLMKV